VIDADVIAHELTAPSGGAMPALVAAFGPGIAAADGRLDRAAMRRLAFADPEARRRLEAILHPLIGRATEERCRTALAAGAPYAVLVVPLLVESPDYRRRVARVAVVDCPVETQIARVMVRSQLSRQEVEAILATQATREERLAVADDVILNDGSREALAARVEELHQLYLQYAAIYPQVSITG
jgi:dephospho-CoA kinase